ncbi:hypothetical protein YC2023_076719 [Brassica napus]
MDPSLPPPFTAFPPFTNSNPFPPPQHPVYGGAVNSSAVAFRTPFLTKKILPYQGVVAWVLTALSSHGKPEMNSFGLLSARLWNTDWLFLFGELLNQSVDRFGIVLILVLLLLVLGRTA